MTDKEKLDMAIEILQTSLAEKEGELDGDMEMNFTDNLRHQETKRIAEEYRYAVKVLEQARRKHDR